MCKMKREETIKPLTKADRIRQMSDEELATLLCGEGWQANEETECPEWLRQPVGGDLE